MTYTFTLVQLKLRARHFKPYQITDMYHQCTQRCSRQIEDSCYMAQDI